MICTSDDPPIRLEWHNDVKSKLWPHRASFSYKHDDYDYLSAEFDVEVANQIRNNENYFDEPSAVTVYIKGTPVRRMYYNPENLMMGKKVDSTQYDGYLELHDLHAHLDAGTVDWQSDSWTSIEKTYREIFRHRNRNPDLFSGIDIRATEKLLSIEQPGFQFTWTGDNIRYGYAIQFDDESLLEAIKKANRKFGVDTHISPDGELVVGSYSSPTKWTASDRGSDVDYLIKNAGITQNSQGVLQRLNIEGPTVFQSKGRLDADEWKEYLNPLGDDEPGYQLHIVVTNTAVNTDNTQSIKMHDMDKFEAIDAAVRKYLAFETSRRSGSVKIDMSSSNTKGAIRIGDVLEISNPVGCGFKEPAAFYGGLYSVSGVRHDFDGIWEADVDVMRAPPSIEDLQVEMQYVDSDSGEVLSFKDVHGFEPQSRADLYAGTIDN